MTYENSEAVIKAVEEADLETLAFLLMKEKPTTATLSIAVRKGQLFLLKFLCEYCHIDECEEAYNLLTEAVLSNHLDIVKFLCSQSIGHEMAIVYAATAGHIDIVQWLHDHGPQRNALSALGMAARCGHMDVVQYLHTKLVDKGIKRAKEGGHQNIIDWLSTKL
jgi:Ankyrin repeats (3 copies)